MHVMQDYSQSIKQNLKYHLLLNKMAIWLISIAPIKTGKYIKIISIKHVLMHNIVVFSFDIDVLRGL